MLSRMAKGFPTIQAKATEEMVQPVHDMQGKRWRQTDSLSLESDMPQTLLPKTPALQESFFFGLVNNGSSTNAHTPFDKTCMNQGGICNWLRKAVSDLGIAVHPPCYGLTTFQSLKHAHHV